MEPTKNLPRLLDLAYAGYNNPAFQPSHGEGGELVTHCNEFILSVLNGFGYGTMNGKVANEIVGFMENPANGWIQVDASVAQTHANGGVVVIAGYSNPTGHGHVCLVLPGILEPSASFGTLVPKCVNVGAQLFFGKKISFAFQPSMKPRFFALTSMI